MTLSILDWCLIAAYLLLSLGIGLWYARRAGKNVGEFFVAGRALPWWIAGTSLVATTFAADTPLVVSGFVRKQGIWGNWYWWSALLGGMVCVFFYARLWRRAGIQTDNEFIELRYSGRSAAALRGFMAVYAGVLSNCIIMGWVTLAMSKIAVVVMGLPETMTLPMPWGAWTVSSGAVVIVVLLVACMVYTVISGLWGVVMTDVFQFVIAMVGSIIFAVIVVMHAGGPAEMVSRIQESPGFRPELLMMTPDFAHAGGLAVFTFAIYLSVQWWGGAQGSGYNAQRLFATINERHAVMAFLWFNFAHFVLRSWPWVLVGLASLIYFPLTSGLDPEQAYPRMMVEFLPSGLLGMMVIVFLAAYMSTLTTHVNWGASYVVIDLYQRFIHPNASTRHYVVVSRLASAALIILAGLSASQMTTIEGAWKYLAKLTAGAGLVGLLRWYWWRVNSWSEISALLASLVMANLTPLISLPGLGRLDQPELYAVELVLVVAVATAVWLTVTFMTSPVEALHLEQFYRRVRPGGWWGPVARACPDVYVPRQARRSWIGWLAGVVCIYASLFGVGFLLLGQPWRGVIGLAIAAISGWVMLTQASALSDTSEKAAGEPSQSELDLITPAVARAGATGE